MTYHFPGCPDSGRAIKTRHKSNVEAVWSATPGKSRFRRFYAKSDFLHGLLAVFLAQMRVSFHQQRAAVLVSKPAGNGGNVRAVFNAGRGEKVAEAVR